MMVLPVLVRGVQCVTSIASHMCTDIMLQSATLVSILGDFLFEVTDI